MKTVQLILPDRTIPAEVDTGTGIIRLGREERQAVFSTDVDILVEVDEVMLDSPVIVNKLSQRLMLSENALAQVQAILAG